MYVGLWLEELTCDYMMRSDTRRTNSRISSTRQTVVRGPSLTGCGYLWSFTPCHHADALMPRTCRICGNRAKPSCGSGSGVLVSLAIVILLFGLGELCRAMCRDNRPIQSSCGGVPADTPRNCTRPGRCSAHRAPVGVLSNRGCFYCNYALK